MIQTLLRSLIVCAFVGSFTVAQPLLGQSDNPANSQNATPAQKKTKRKVYKGTIKAIDTVAGTVTVKKATTSKTFKLAGDAKFVTSDNKNASLAPLQPGDLVNIRFTEDGETATAHHIAEAGKNSGKSAKKPK